MLALVAAAASVMLSLPEPPVMVSVFETEAVLVTLAERQRVAARTEIDAAVHQHRARVIASAPEPPISVVTFLTVPVFAVLARVSLLAPVPRSIAMAVVSAVARVMVSLTEPP